MIPEEKREVVTRGLSAAFGVTKLDEIRMLTKGQTSALVFRIVVEGRAYLLRLILRTDDATRHYACMRLAAEAGVAPRVWYASVEDRISITDFVEATDFPAKTALVRMPGLLRAVHALPVFEGLESPYNTSCTFLLSEGPAVEGFLRRFEAAKVLSAAESEELLTRYAEVAAVYPRDGSERVLSHNDLFKPDNILYDGERVWLVDWEAAFLNDRYADLAVVAHLLVSSDGEERDFLEAYLGRPADEYELARFFLMRQLAHIFYAMVFLPMGELGESAPAFEEFQRRFWSGEVTLEDRQAKCLYGRVHLDELLRRTREARWKEALRIVSGGAG